MPVEEAGKFHYWRDPVFLACLAVYVVNRFLIKPNLHFYSPFFHGHLDDTLTIPVALPPYLLFYRWLRFRPDDEPPRSWEVGLHLALWLVCFKWFGPLVLHRGAYDPVDDWCIAAGGLGAWLLWQRRYFLSAFAPETEDAPSDAWTK
jgi:hypothetical protein